VKLVSEMHHQRGNEPKCVERVLSVVSVLGRGHCECTVSFYAHSTYQTAQASCSKPLAAVLIRS